MKPSYFLLIVVVLKLQSSFASSDPHSYANVDEIQIKHIALKLKADFKSKRLKGTATLKLQYLKPSNNLLLDSRDLTILTIQGLCNKSWQRLDFKIADADPILGSKISIRLFDKKACSEVRVQYQTSPKASGLQWLDKALTAGKKHPFLFSQSEPLHGRSWIPMQDTPAIRLTYSATIETPKPLRALMSANNDPNAELDGSFDFEMTQPISPYLIALAIADVKYHRWTERTGVWAEPPLLEAAAKEFEDTEKMIVATEKTFGKYPWGQYDLLILPASFPFGGMENPRLSFITPTVITGDKSLTSMISHELAHSWSGNLVTNATWGDLWLNEGITTYLENRIIEDVYGRSMAEMEAVVGFQSLQKDLASLNENEQSLFQNLQNKDPDDAFTDIPYYKGQLFLFYLEKNFGRKNIDTFLKKYFNDFKFKTITTEQFVIYLKKNLLDKHLNIDINISNINHWIYSPGLPKDAFIPQSLLLKKVDEAILLWKKKPLHPEQLPAKQWSTQEWVYFLNNLPRQISLSKLKKLDNAYHLSPTANAEIALAWFPLVIINNHQAGFGDLKTYLMKIGRIRLIFPLYELIEENPELRTWGEKIYQQARAGYHPLTKQFIDELFYKDI